MSMAPSFNDTTPIGQDGLYLKNRLVKAAMVEGLCSVITGEPNEAHYRLYKTWAEADFGMVISGNVCISNDHLGTPGDLRLPLELTELALQPWRQLAACMTAHDTLGILQLVHTGRQSVRCAGRLPFTAPMAPSSIRVNTHPSNIIGKIVEQIAFQTPKEMTVQDIQEVIRNFVHGAKLAKKAGFHGVEIHASHGYLISSFLSPRTNQRKDTYGGSTEARLKILLEIIEAIRDEVERPFLLGVKLNSADYVDGGLSGEEALRHVELLTQQGGLDFIEISGGLYESLAFLDADSAPARSARTEAREAIFSAFSSRAKSVATEAAERAQSERATAMEVTVPLIMCTGGFRSREGIQQALQDGIDLVGVGRPAAADPTWTSRLLSHPDSLSNGTSENHAKTDENRCISYTVTGGEWLQTLVPLKLVGGSVNTLWHQMQMRRIARGVAVRPDWTFERLLAVELFQGLKRSLSLAVLLAVLAWLAALLVEVDGRTCAFNTDEP